MNLRTQRIRAAGLLALAVACSVPSASAQVAPAAKPATADESLKLEKFVVTGSLIKRV